MSRKLQAILSDAAWLELDRVFNEATEGFKVGTIKQSDVLSEMILTSKVDIKELRAKHTNLKKSLINLAHAESVDIDTAIKTLQEIKNKMAKKSAKGNQTSDEASV